MHPYVSWCLRVKGKNEKLLLTENLFSVILHYLKLLLIGDLWMRDLMLVTIVASDGLVLKHQAISSHNVNLIPVLPILSIL